MAIKLISNYAKRLGLPGYSSHQFSVSLESELTDLSQVQVEVARLYELLQDAVDREIQQSGYVPGQASGGIPQSQNGNGTPSPNGNGNGHGHGKHHYRLSGGNGSSGTSDRWACSDKQKELIQKLVRENGLDWESVEQIALDRFGVGLPLLNKLQASGFIGEVIEVCGNQSRSRKGGAR